MAARARVFSRGSTFGGGGGYSGFGPNPDDERRAERGIQTMRYLDEEQHRQLEEQRYPGAGKPDFAENERLAREEKHTEYFAQSWPSTRRVGQREDCP